MKKIKKIVGIILVMCLALCCTSCMKFDVGISVQENGTASMTTKISIVKDLYDMMVANQSDEDVNIEVNGYNEEEAVVEDGDEKQSLDLNLFVEETIDEKTYYSYSETKDYSSYDSLIADLRLLEVTDGVPLFETLTIRADGNGGYSFEATTFEIGEDSFAGEETESITLPENWLTLSMTVKMPGEVQEFVGGEKLEDGSVRFLLTDFSEKETLFVASQVEKANVFKDVFIWVVGLSIISFVVTARFMPTRNLNKTSSDADEEDSTN